MKQQNIPCAAAQKGEAMNVKKAADYSVMYRKLTGILARNLPQMDENRLDIECGHCGGSAGKR